MRKFLFIAMVLLLSGCLSNPQYDRSFSKEWAYQVQREAEFQKRREVAHEKDKDPGAEHGGRDIVLGPPPSNVDTMDIGAGKPNDKDVETKITERNTSMNPTSTGSNSGLSIGNQTGLGADIGANGAGLHYKIKW